MKKIMVYKLYDYNGKKLNEFYHELEHSLDINLLSKFSFKRMNIKIVDIY